MTTLVYPFTEQDMAAARREWGCNCGPSALAFAIQQPLSAARFAIRDFERKRYTSPMMMRNALNELRVRWWPVAPVCRDEMFGVAPALVRIQWTGPWTAAGSNPRWAYTHTHWIATWRQGPAVEGGFPLVFDCNGGVRGIDSWESEIVPLLLPKRGDGKWAPTHIWRVIPLKRQTPSPAPDGAAREAGDESGDDRRPAERVRPGQ